MRFYTIIAVGLIIVASLLGYRAWVLSDAIIMAGVLVVYCMALVCLCLARLDPIVDWVTGIATKEYEEIEDRVMALGAAAATECLGMPVDVDGLEDIDTAFGYIEEGLYRNKTSRKSA